MAKLMKMLQPLQSEYVDRRFDGTKEEYFRQLELSSTLYIGNLSFYTTEDQIYTLFGKVGAVRRVLMGLDRNSKTPCGFCFVIYHTRKDALAAVKYLNGTKLDNRQLRVDIDYGFEEGRQFGRGRSGGQVRDEFRTDYDADRGGFGRVVAQQMASQQMAMWQEVQAGALLGAGMLPAAAGGAVFFGQDQRQALGQHKAAQGDGQHAGAEEGGDEADSSAVINPRMAGRGRDDDDDDQEEDEEEREHRRIKRRRVGSEDGGAEEPAAASAAAGGEEEEAGGEAAGEEDTAAAGAQAGAGEDGEGVLDFQSDEDEEAAEPRKRQRVQ